jgi:hypothetical protein
MSDFPTPVVDDGQDVADFDAFLQGRRVAEKRGARLRLCGVEYELPTQMPVAYLLLQERYKDDNDPRAIRAVLEPLFGREALDLWSDSGLGEFDMRVVLHWSAQNMASPGSLSMEDAYEAVLTDNGGAGLGKAPGNRAERRAAQRKPKPKKRRTSGG